MNQINFMDEAKLLEQHFRKPKERQFLQKEKGKTTLLFSGLPLNYEHLLKGALESLGYKAQYLPLADEESLSYGKEFCNRGLCNPAYYTVGNLAKYLDQLKEQGETNIEERYAYITAADCGSCRFSMYEAEYRKVLADKGYPNFRLITFQQTGIAQFDDEKINFDTEFYMRLGKAALLGDFLQELSYKIRPYEVIKGQTDEVMEESREILYQALKDKKNSIFKALGQTKKLIDTIEVDYTRVKPKIAVVGEFYAHTIEGAPNHNILRWLESEGAEVEVPRINGVLEIVVDWTEFNAKRRLGLKNAGKGQLALLVQLRILKSLFKLYYYIYRAAFSFYPSPMLPLKKFDKYMKSYYDPAFKGESYMEVAKHLLAFKDKKAHMVVSVKPFGCMPSTQSDGIHAKVMTDLSDSIFVSVETNGDSEVHFKSRVLMKLFEAKNKAKEEFEMVMEKNGLTEEDILLYKKHKKLFYKPTNTNIHQYTGTAAEFITKHKKEIKNCAEKHTSSDIKNDMQLGFEKINRNDI